MNQGNGTTNGLPESLKKIIELFSAITPEQFPITTTKPGKDDHVAGVASEDIKKLVTLRGHLLKEIREIALRGRQAAETALREARGKDPRQVVEEVETPGTAAFAAKEEMLKLRAEIMQAENQMTAVGALLQLELGRQFPELLQKPVHIYGDWSLCWRDPQNEMPNIVSINIGSVDDLAELLGRHTHSH